MDPKIYTKLINSALKLEKKEPREIPPEPLPILQRVKDKMLETVQPKKSAKRAYAILVSALSGSTTVLRSRVPLDQLHSTMSEEVHKIQCAAIMAGAFPIKVHLQSRFFTLFDFGHSRVLCLRVQLAPAIERPSTANFIVEETTYDEINFDLVKSFPPKEPIILDASITQAPHIKETRR